MPNETKSRVSVLRESLRHSEEAVRQAGIKLTTYLAEKRSAAAIAEARQAYELAREAHRKFLKQMGE